MYNQPNRPDDYLPILILIFVFLLLIGIVSIFLFNVNSQVHSKILQEGESKMQNDYLRKVMVSDAVSLDPEIKTEMKKEHLQAVKLLKMDEGLRLKIYKDTKGLDTIGFGHNVSGRKLTKKEHKHLFPNRKYHIPISEMVQIWSSIGITKEDAEYLLEQDIKLAEKDLITIFGDYWNQIPLTKKVFLTDMSFNLGLSRMSGFRKMIAAIKIKDWKKAGKECRNSEAYRELPKRYECIARGLEEGN